MATADQTVILRVALDSAQTEQQLQTLVLDIETTKKAQQALTAARKAGELADAEYAQQTVVLRNQLRAQQQEQTALTKNLELYRTATGELANTYKGTQAQLSLAQRQFQALEGSQDTSTESTKALAATIAELRGTLKSTDEAQLLFVRNVGNYPKGESLAPLVQQLVRVEELMKSGALTAEQSATASQAVIGFKQQIAQAGAAEGKSYEETTAFVKQYGEAVRPATADLLKLEQEQQRLAASGADAGEAMEQVGFKIGAARKAIADTATTTQQAAGTLDRAESSFGKLGDQAQALPGPLGQVTGGLAGTAQGFVGAARAALAFIATPIGAVLAVITGLFYALKEALTATDEGQENLAAGLAGFKAILGVLQGVVIAVGKALIMLFTEPKKFAQELGDFIETNLMNRVKAFGVIWDGIRNGDLSQLNNGILQAATGVENLTGKAAEFTAELKRAALASAEISRLNDKLEDQQIDAITLNETAKQQAERLVLTAKDRTLSEAQRLRNLDQAGKLETEVLNRNLAIERQRLLVLRLQNTEAERKGVLQDDARKAEAEQFANVTRLQGEFEARQQQIQNRRSVLLQQERAADKAASDAARQAAEKAAEARLKQQREALALQAQLVERQLQQVRVGSDEEISLLQQKLRIGRDVELAQKDLTVRQKLLLDRTYEADSLDLTREFNKARALADFDALSQNIQTDLLTVKRGTEEETRLRALAIDAQLQKDLAALDRRKDLTAQEALLRATAAKATNDVNYTAALGKLEQFLADQRQAIERDNAAGLTTTQQYQTAVLLAEQIAADTRLSLARNFNQDTAELERRSADAKIAQMRRVTEAEQAIQQQRVQLAEGLAGGLSSLFAETVATTGATMDDFARKALILVIDTMQKTLIAAQVKIIAESFASADSIATFGASGLAKSLLIIAAVTALSETFKAQLTPAPRQFARGGVLSGPDHAGGGVPLYGRGGAYYGEAEGDEVILTKGVWRNPQLRPLASALNQLGGGAALLPRPHLALGGLTAPVAYEQLRGGTAAGADAAAIGAAVARSLRQNPPVTRWSDFKQAEARNSFSDALGNA